VIGAIQRREFDVTVCEVVTPWAYPEREFTSRATVSVVIPTLNEARNIAHVLPKLPAGVDEVVLVDGGSTDGTVEVARRLRPDLTIIQQTRRGKGNALACGFAAATGDIIVMMDADGSTHPAEISRFVEALVKSGADFAKGSRFVPGGGSSDITSLRRVGNSFLSKLVNTFCRTRYTDLCYGFNAFWRRCLPALDLEQGSEMIEDSAHEPMRWGDGFEIETLITMRVARANLEIIEVPSFEHGRLHGQSNLNAFSDGLRVLRTIFAEGKRRSVKAEDQGVSMAPILELHAPQRDREAALRMFGFESAYPEVAEQGT
jgi:glycosyltransferase involved in cell wall biosynthesis